ncbi:unnamed protein product, partial [Polarella glacialis]
MEEPHDASLAELQKRVSQVVKKVLQEELQEVKDLLVCLLRQQSKKTQSTAPKPERCKRLAPAVMPRRFTDQHGSKGQPVTLKQLQDNHAEWLQEQHAEWSDDMRSQSPVSTPSALRSVIAAASLKPKTGNESAASASVSVIPVTQSTAPKPERCKRLAPAVMPRRFTDQHGSKSQPVTLEQLQDKQAEWLQEQHAEWSDDMRSQSPVSTPSALRSVIAAASLKPKTGNESAASASVSVIPVTQSTAPKPERCKRLAPAVMPRRFTDQHGSKGQPVTLEQLQDKQAEWLQEQHAEWSDDMRSQSPVSTPSALRSVIAAASLEPKTGNESAASASVSVIP